MASQQQAALQEEVPADIAPLPIDDADHQAVDQHQAEGDQVMAAESAA
jgi:hypothetical protein